jgi:hypothetical protein
VDSWVWFGTFILRIGRKCNQKFIRQGMFLFYPGKGHIEFRMDILCFGVQNLYTLRFKEKLLELLKLSSIIHKVRSETNFTSINLGISISSLGDLQINFQSINPKHKFIHILTAYHIHMFSNFKLPSFLSKITSSNEDTQNSCATSFNTDS